MSGQSEFGLDVQAIVKLEIGWHPAVIPTRTYNKIHKQYTRFISGGKGVLLPP